MGFSIGFLFAMELHCYIADLAFRFCRFGNKLMLERGACNGRMLLW